MPSAAEEAEEEEEAQEAVEEAAAEVSAAVAVVGSVAASEEETQDSGVRAAAMQAPADTVTAGTMAAAVTVAGIAAELIAAAMVMAAVTEVVIMAVTALTAHTGAGSDSASGSVIMDMAGLTTMVIPIPMDTPTLIIPTLIIQIHLTQILTIPTRMTTETLTRTPNQPNPLLLPEIKMTTDLIRGRAVTLTNTARTEIPCRTGRGPIMPHPVLLPRKSG